MHERLTEPCTFIIDDWQYVNAVTEVRGLWNQILRDAPPTCRFVFASRVKPKLQFARFKTHAGYAELRTDALRFTEPEIAELFRDIYNDPLEAADVSELDRRTEGWAASLQLVEVSVRDLATSGDRSEFIRSISATRDSDLFDFLAEEVLDQQPEETRNFLLSTAILQQMTPEVSERLTGIQDGPRTLAELENRGLFTSRLDDVRYRYHHLFRDFLERRLVTERSESEVTGLHIHAASYFETSEQWPEAIHHYLRAGLHRQAARLIAKYGEDVAAEGRLGLVDEWLPQLPSESIRSNARLSLLAGEARGMRGEWAQAIEALERARGYFARKGDRRFEALACLKLSSVYSNYGDPEQAALVAQAGAEIVPADDSATRLRLEGNLAITKGWLTSPLDEVLAECRRIASESSSRGLEHFAAIAEHNIGTLLAEMGRFAEAITHLEQASAFWSGPPTSPFVDDCELVCALLSVGDLARARDVASDSLIRTRPWARPHALAALGQAAIDVVDGRLSESIARLEETVQNPSVLGANLNNLLDAALCEALYLAGAEGDRVRAVAERLKSRASDPRYAGHIAAARALAVHASTSSCDGECMRLNGTDTFAAAGSTDAMPMITAVKLGALRMAHQRRRGDRDAWAAVAKSLDAGLALRLRPWLRQYSPYVATSLGVRGGASLVTRLADADPDGWREALVRALAVATGPDRTHLLEATSRHADKRTIEALHQLPGKDIADARRRLRNSTASRLYLRTFGGVSLHRGSWTGPPLPIEKKRVRMLLAVLAAQSETILTRDMAVDIMWPDADPVAAVNNLNQTVFQLRRYIDPAYRGGESPDYVVSSSEQVAFNPRLVRTDLAEVRDLAGRLSGADWKRRNAAAARAIELVRGEFLADLRYEDWALAQQRAVHSEVRSCFLTIATRPDGFDVDVAMRAASALVLLDQYDETAVLVLANCLEKSGQRVAARDLIVDFARRIHAELEEPPSVALANAAQRLGGLDRINRQLTGARN